MQRPYPHIPGSKLVHHFSSNSSEKQRCSKPRRSNYWLETKSRCHKNKYQRWKRVFITCKLSRCVRVMTLCPGLSSAESPWLNGTPWSPPGLPLQHTKTWVQDDENNNNDENNNDENSNNDDENNKNNNDDHNNDNNKNTTLKTRSQETYQI